MFNYEPDPYVEYEEDLKELGYIPPVVPQNPIKPVEYVEDLPF
jgi:hypothetical protein